MSESGKSLGLFEEKCRFCHQRCQGCWYIDGVVCRVVFGGDEENGAREILNFSWRERIWVLVLVARSQFHPTLYYQSHFHHSV